MIKGIAYVGVAVKDIERAREKFKELLGSEIIRVGASEIDYVKNRISQWVRMSSS